jgi:ABC-type branched-subunit amino acid transport system substrate-binding protein
MESGLVHMTLGEYEAAINAFQRILSLHEGSDFVPQAGYQLALACYQGGKFDAAIRQAEDTLKRAETDGQRFRLYNLLGYAHSATGNFRKAVRSYMDAYAHGAGKPHRQAEILNRVKEVLPFLDTGELKALIEIFDGQPPGGYLRVELAKQYASENEIESALQILSDFFQLHPNHEALGKAVELRRELESRAIVDRFLIGCILPLSGPYSAFGQRALTGVELALDLFNAQVHTHPVQLAVKDSKGDPEEALAALKALALKEGVIGILGPMITSESVAPEAESLKIPIITFTQKPEITTIGDYIFRNFLTLSSQVETLVDYSVNDLGLRSFAILYPNEPYGISFMNRFWDEVIDQGAEVVGVESYGPEQTDFSDEIRKLVGLYYPRPEPDEKEWTTAESRAWETLTNLRWTDMPGPESEEPRGAADNTIFTLDDGQEAEDEEPEPIVDFQAIFIPDSHGKVGLITPQLLYHGIEDVLLLGSNLWHSPKLIQMAREYVQGAVIPEGFFAQSPLPDVANFVKNYQSVFTGIPGYLEAQAYDTAWILCEATNTPGVDSRMALKRALSGVTDFPGVTGNTSFDERGEVRKGSYLLKIKDDRFIQIRP